MIINYLNAPLYRKSRLTTKFVSYCIQLESASWQAATSGISIAKSAVLLSSAKYDYW